MNRIDHILNSLPGYSKVSDEDMLLVREALHEAIYLGAKLGVRGEMLGRWAAQGIGGVERSLRDRGVEFGGHVGGNTHRLKSNPQEQVFADKWKELNNKRARVLAHILAKEPNRPYPDEPTDREKRVAATVIQWLGSPVGQGFLMECGYSRFDVP